MMMMMSQKVETRGGGGGEETSHRHTTGSVLIEYEPCSAVGLTTPLTLAGFECVPALSCITAYPLRCEMSSSNCPVE
jgi:hypothetical protein